MTDHMIGTDRECQGMIGVERGRVKYVRVIEVSGPRMVHYPLDVQPILDRHCLACHSGDKPKGDLVLSGEATTMWSRSYENLINKRLVSQLDGGYGAAYIQATPPLAFGSHRSKLIERIRKDPCKADLTQEDFVRIVTWIDANVPFYGTHQGRKHIKWQAEAGLPPAAVGCGQPRVVKKAVAGHSGQPPEGRRTGARLAPAPSSPVLVARSRRPTPPLSVDQPSPKRYGSASDSGRR